jgi:serine/threonine protein kinase
MYLIIEYCNKGDLSALISKEGILPELTVKEIIRQIGILLWAFF